MAPTFPRSHAGHDVRVRRTHDPVCSHGRILRRQHLIQRRRRVRGGGARAFAKVQRHLWRSNPSACCSSTAGAQLLVVESLLRRSPPRPLPPRRRRRRTLRPIPPPRPLNSSTAPHFIVLSTGVVRRSVILSATSHAEDIAVDWIPRSSTGFTPPARMIPKLRARRYRRG